MGVKESKIHYFQKPSLQMRVALLRFHWGENNKYHVLWKILKDTIFHKLMQIIFGMPTLSSCCFCSLATYTLAIVARLVLDEVW